jgi:hypothetical protein
MDTPQTLLAKDKSQLAADLKADRIHGSDTFTLDLETDLRHLPKDYRNKLLTAASVMMRTNGFPEPQITDTVSLAKDTIQLAADLKVDPTSNNQLDALTKHLTGDLEKLPRDYQNKLLTAARVMMTTNGVSLDQIRDTLSSALEGTYKHELDADAKAKDISKFVGDLGTALKDNRLLDSGYARLSRTARDPLHTIFHLTDQEINSLCAPRPLPDAWPLQPPAPSKM